MSTARQIQTSDIIPLLAGGVPQISLAPTAASLNPGISLSQSLSGAVGSSDSGYPNFWANFLNVTSDVADVAGNFGSAETVVHHFGGAAMKGGRNSFAVYSYLDAASNSSNTNRNYVGGQFNIRANSADGGTDTNAGAKGAIFGLSLAAGAANGAINLYELSCGEFNTFAQAGSSVKYKNIISLVGRNDDAVQGAVYDCMLALSNQSGAVSWNDGILIGPMNSQFPLKSSGTIMRTIGGTVANGIDFSTSTISGALLKGPAGYALSTGNGKTLEINDRGSTVANYWQLKGSAASSAPLMLAQGSDTIVNIGIGGKGTTHVVELAVLSDVGNGALRVSAVASQVNQVRVVGAAAGSPATISAGGADTNIDLPLSGKGTGFVRAANFFMRQGVATTITPPSNGDLAFEFTSNTSVTVRGRGSDGTVRTSTLTLA